MSSRPGADKPFRFGVVGAGRMGQTHLRALEESSRVRVVAVVDTSPEVRVSLEQRGFKAYQSVRELVDAGDVDGVLVAAPTSLHLQIVRTLLAARLPVLCEKPCGMNPGEARQAGAMAEEAGVILQVAFWRRFIPALRSLRHRIQAGELGGLYCVACLQWDQYPVGPAFRATSGGILRDMGVHDFDMLRWLTDQDIVAASGFSSSTSIEPPFPGDPEAVELVLQLSGGTVAAVSLGRRFPPGEIHRVQVMGTKEAEDLIYAPSDSTWEPWGPIYPALRAQAEAFADTVEGAPLQGADAGDAAAALAAADLAEHALAVTQPLA